MQKLYEKSEITFAILWIVIYVVGTGLADGLSASLGLEKGLTCLLHLLMSAILLRWAKSRGLFEKYGLCRTDVPAARFFYYVPLFVLMSCNLWFGIQLQLPFPEALFYVISMLCVGFLEEFIFRGLLFRAMSADHVPSAIVVSSLTFGIGHLVNLFNGSGMGLLANLCQVLYAAAFGFMTVIIVYRGRTLLPCIAVHSVVNGLSVLTPGPSGAVGEILSALCLIVVSGGYCLALLKTLPEGK